MRHAMIVLFFTIGLLPVASGQVEGAWKGEISVPGSPLEITVAFSREGDAWSAKLDIPQQGASELPLEKVSIGADRSVKFELPSPLGRAYFTGKLDVEKETIVGTFKQGPLDCAFDLARPEKADLGERLDGIDGVIEAIREQWDVPGVSVAVVQGSEVLMAKGYGLRDRERDLPATADTLYAIGSTTKAFTTMVMGMLVEEEKLDWDRPVVDYLPGFKLHDEFATMRITPRDLVTHRSGLPRHDAVWYGSPRSREELVAALAHLEPNRGLRTRFQYQNLMYMTAGHLAGKVAGTTWEDLVRKRLLDPLGMKRSNFSVTVSQKDDDFAQPYRDGENETERCDFRNIDTVGPAGSINSSVNEMARWLMLHTGKGKVGDERLVKAKTALEMITPQMVIAQPPTDRDTPVVCYGLGWMVAPYRGHLTAQHGGGIDGFTAMVALLPHEDVGIVVLTNKGGTPAPTFTALAIADRLLGLEPKERGKGAGAATARAARARQKAEKLAKVEKGRKKGTRPSHEPTAYAGTYRHAGYGDAVVTEKDGKLTIKYNGMDALLEHYHHDVFLTKGENADSDPVVFTTSADGMVDTVSSEFEGAVGPIVFKRVK